MYPLWTHCAFFFKIPSFHRCRDAACRVSGPILLHVRAADRTEGKHNGKHRGTHRETQEYIPGDAARRVSTIYNKV